MLETTFPYEREQFLYPQVFYYSTNLFMTTGLTESHAKYATIGIGAVMVVMTLISIPLMDKSGRRTLHLYGLGGMFVFSIFITISFLVKVSRDQFYNMGLECKTYFFFNLHGGIYVKTRPRSPTWPQATTLGKSSSSLEYLGQNPDSVLHTFAQA